MTVLLTLEHAKLSNAVTVSPQAAAVGESSAGIVAGEKLTVRQLLQAALIASANDAADALASYVGHGSETRFVAMMNARARRLGFARRTTSGPTASTLQVTSPALATSPSSRGC
jgi:D-alanyl-D-alanine carboxypeptidase (penicillin-binding protein 5/6)